MNAQRALKILNEAFLPNFAFKALANSIPLPTTTMSISFEGRFSNQSRTYPPIT